MPVIFGCLVPHPPIIIPEIGRENLERVSATVNAMITVSGMIADTEPETLVFISPHSVGFADRIAVKTDTPLTGSFADFGYDKPFYSVENDLAFINALVDAVNELNIDMVRVGKGHVSLPGAGNLDHGILVPLHYISKELMSPVVCISIDHKGFDEHFALGKAIRKASDVIDRRIAIIASGDLSHRLIPGAPAGYNPKGADFETAIEEIFESGAFDNLPSLDPKLVDGAGECGLRSIYALAGAFEGILFDTSVLSHEGPFGVGYMVATIRPRTANYVQANIGITEDAETFADPKSDQPGPSVPVRLAMYSLMKYFAGDTAAEPPENTPYELLNRQAGAFVCLKIEGTLRGCVGTIQATHNNIAEEIMTNAIQAAVADPRFYPVTEDELPLLSFSVDILGEPEKISSKSQLDPKIYGVIVGRGDRTGLLLPDIDGVDTVEQQIAIAKKKAGIRLHEDTDLYRFSVIRYE